MQRTQSDLPSQLFPNINPICGGRVTLQTQRGRKNMLDKAMVHFGREYRNPLPESVMFGLPCMKTMWQGVAGALLCTHEAEIRHAPHMHS